MPLPQNNLETPQHYHAQGNGQDSALTLLAQASHLSKNELKQLATKGAIWLSKDTQTKQQALRLRRLKKVPNAQESLDLYFHPKVQNIEVAAAHLIADYKDYSVWYKPKLMLSQGSKYGDFSALPRWVELHTQRPCWQIHRLDRATDGLMLIAHNKKTAAKLIQAFSTRQVDKTYHALVWGTPLQSSWRCDTPVHDKPALSHFQLLRTGQLNGQSASVIEINIETGRKHQIRTHLSEAGLPIIGDRLYGMDKDTGNIDLQLSAVRLAFTDPNTDERHTIDLPASLYALHSLD